jgi:hypothetical protein
MGCIFCSGQENLTDEHVFPAFMGGELEVRNGSCTRCNGDFGVAEAALKEATTPLLIFHSSAKCFPRPPSLRTEMPLMRSGIQSFRHSAHRKG